MSSAPLLHVDGLAQEHGVLLLVLLLLLHDESVLEVEQVLIVRLVGVREQVVGAPGGDCRRQPRTPPIAQACGLRYVVVQDGL